MRLRWRALLPLVAIALPIVAIAWFAGNLQRYPIAMEFVTFLRSVSHEWWAIPLFFAMYVVCAVCFLPITPLSAAGALAWGWKVGGLIEVFGVTIGALAPFYLARRGLSPSLTRFLARRGFVFDPLPRRRETFVLLVLRILTIVPYVALNYIAGLARIRPRDYIWATFLGSIPPVFVFAWFVDTLGGSATGVVTRFRLFVVCAVVALVAIVMKMVSSRLRQRLLSREAAALQPDGDDPRSASTELPPE